MLVIFGILVIVASLILGLIILVQNPKGGGLSASFGGIGNNLMGVKQTTDILEKGTWLFAIIVGVLCITSSLFIPATSSKNAVNNEYYNNTPTNTPATPKTTAPLQTAPAKP